jgi:uncharacterized membrane protein YkgB
MEACSSERTDSVGTKQRYNLKRRTIQEVKHYTYVYILGKEACGKIEVIIQDLLANIVIITSRSNSPTRKRTIYYGRIIIFVIFLSTVSFKIKRNDSYTNNAGNIFVFKTKPRKSTTVEYFSIRYAQTKSSHS